MSVPHTPPATTSTTICLPLRVALRQSIEQHEVYQYRFDKILVFFPCVMMLAFVFKFTPKVIGLVFIIGFGFLSVAFHTVDSAIVHVEAMMTLIHKVAAGQILDSDLVVTSMVAKSAWKSPSTMNTIWPIRRRVLRGELLYVSREIMTDHPTLVFPYNCFFPIDPRTNIIELSVLGSQ